MHGWRRSIVGIVFVAAMVSPGLFVAGCKRSAPPGREAPGRPARGPRESGVGDDSLTPLETLRRVRRHHIEGRLERIEPYLPPDQQGPVIELIQSMDRLRWANDVLQDAVTRHFGPATARLFDRSDVVNAIGVFSRDVEFLEERISGETAVVTIQIAGRIPLEEIALERSAGRWVLHTDPPVPGVAEALRDLGDVLVDTARVLDRRPLTAAELRRDLAAREAAIGRRINALTENRPQTE